MGEIHPGSPAPSAGMRRKRVVIISFGLLLSTLLLSFPVRAEEKVELEVACFRGGYGIDFFEKCAREYEQQHPNVKINLWGDPRVWEKLTPRFAAGTPPDLCWPGWGMNIWPLVFDQQLLALDKYLAQPAHGSSKPWGETFVPSLLAKGKADGKTYLLPYNFDAFAWWYNKRMFRDHGWTPPKTYDEMLALCEQIKKAGVAPVVFTGRYPIYALQGFYFPWVISAGGLQVYKDALNLKPGAWRHPAFLKAAKCVMEMKRRENFETGCIGMNHTESQMEFLVGRAAVVPCGTWLHSEMEKLLPPDFEMEMMLCPVFGDGVGDPSVLDAAIDGKGWCIPAKGKHPDVAADFFRYASSPEKSKQFIEQKGTLMSVMTEGKITPPPHLETPLRLVREAKATWAVDISDWYPAFETEIDATFVDMYNGLITPEQFIERVEAESQKVRDDNTIRKFKAE